MASGTFQVVKLKQGKHSFEVACKVGSVLKFRKGLIGFDNVLQSEEIWKDIKKGDRASGDDLKQAFETDNVKKIAQIIVDKGDVQLTDAERKDIIDKKRNEIINYIHKYYIDPKTKTMIPITRIDAAFNELKIRIDIDQPVDRQINDIIKKLPGVLTIKRAEISGTVSTTHQFLANVTGVFKKYNITIQSENYSSDGCDYGISMVPGDYDKVIADLNNATKGEFQFKIDGGGAPNAFDQAPPTKGGRGGRGKGRGGGGRAGGKAPEEAKQPAVQSNATEEAPAVQSNATSDQDPSPVPAPAATAHTEPTSPKPSPSVKTEGGKGKAPSTTSTNNNNAANEPVSPRGGGRGGKGAASTNNSNTNEPASPRGGAKAPASPSNEPSSPRGGAPPNSAGRGGKAGRDADGGARGRGGRKK